jgi:TIR domain
MYTSKDATRAYWEYFLAQGFDERQIMQPSDSDYDPGDGRKFVHRDSEGKFEFQVEFLDGDGNAIVSFPNGDSGEVCIFPKVSGSHTPRRYDSGQNKKMEIEPGDRVPPYVPELGTTSAQSSNTGKATHPIPLFYSYSHKDEALRDKLEESLALLKREGIISGWHDRRIVAGDEWEDAIDESLEEAQVILLLISPSFIASNYAWEKETKRAMERHERGEARVIPIILRPCDWQRAPFGKLQALPKGGKPIIKWRPRDDGFKDVAEGLRRVIEDMPVNPR